MVSFSSTSIPKSGLLSSQPIFFLVIALQDPVRGLVEFHEVCLSPPLKLSREEMKGMPEATPQVVKVPLDEIPSLQHADSTTQPCVLGKPAESALGPTVHVAKEDVKWYLCHY